MKRLLQKKVSVFGKEVSVLVMVVLTGVLVSAALISYYGQINQTVEISQGVIFTGCGESVCVDDLTIDACGEDRSQEYKVESQTSVIVPLDISTTTNPDDGGLTTTTEFILDPEGSCGGDDCEKRIFIDGSDVGVTTLNDLNSMSWDVNVVDGYIAHVDVIIDTDGDEERDDALVFEYAKVDPNDCDDSGDYPAGEVNTFNDKGIVNNSAYAWLNSGAPGPCGGTGFIHGSLSDWKAGTVNETVSGSTAIIGFEIEVDNWIENSKSVISNITINGAEVEISLLPDDELNFDILAEASCLVGNDTYIINTTVTAR